MSGISNEQLMQGIFERRGYPTPVFYVTRILDKGTKAECVQTWEGPFKTQEEAQECLNKLNEVQPQFEFFIETEKADGSRRTI